jgi:hypothetical protein
MKLRMLICLTDEVKDAPILTDEVKDAPISY